MTAAELRGHKQAIRAFLQTEIWTEEKLCALLAHAQDKLALWSCCCLVGVGTADHALRGAMAPNLWGSHYERAKRLPLAAAAECAFAKLGFRQKFGFTDTLRRSRIRPIIRAELKRRAFLRNQLPLVAGEHSAERTEAALSAA